MPEPDSNAMTGGVTDCRIDSSSSNKAMSYSRMLVPSARDPDVA